jgi:hypothetical protein
MRVGTCRPDDRRGRPVSSKSESFKARRRSHPCSSSNARDVERSRFAAICVFRSATLCSAVPIAPKPTLPGHIVSLSRRLIDEVKDLRRQAAATAAAPPEISASGLADRGERRRRMSKAHSRFTTTTPATPPASLICPLCDRPLAHDRSYVGGVSDRQSEQWDYYMCPTCGPFQYRQRTRKLHRVDSVP